MGLLGPLFLGIGQRDIHDSEKYLFFDLAIDALVDLIEVPNVNI